MSAVGKRDTRIPRRPLLFLAGALLFTVPPMFGTLRTWVPVLFLATIAAKFWMEARGLRLRSLIWKVVLAIVTLGAVSLSYGSLKGIEPGVSLLVVLMSLKILEAHTARDFQVMVMVAWVLCLCGFIMSQDLAIALSLLLGFALLLGALVQFHRGSSIGAFWPPLRVAGKLLLHALPIVALLFLFFPRVSTGFRFPVADPNSSAPGFSDRMSPGSVISITNSPEVAFRAEFPDGRVPARAGMYWRGAVMWEGDRFEWKTAAFPAAITRAPQVRSGAAAVRQRITLEPNQARWMFALDWPLEPPPGATLAPGNYLWSGRPIRRTRQYEVRSVDQFPEKELRPREREICLRVPDSLSPAVRELAQSWNAGSNDPRAIVKNALTFFQTQGFRYSLSPGEYREDGFDEFLFRRRIGFCEHYAASFATLMRAAGVPARVVVGYLGGEFNAFGRFFLVRQADAHAWTEVWMPETGWERVDPTNVVAPDRVNLGFDAFLERRAASGQERVPAARSGFAQRLAGRPLFAEVAGAWDALNFAWHTRVLSFDVEGQRAFFSAIQLGDTRPLSLIVRCLLAAAVLLVLYGAWMQMRTRAPSDRVKELYDRFCRKAARSGAERLPFEGPADFARRAAALLPQESGRIRQICDAYIALRYSAEPAPSLRDEFAAEVRAFAPRRRAWSVSCTLFC
ncbi:MAG: DUF3488 domain-containing transglutaminase family protein [Chthoniobacterales bacterium]|nr:DUF3488 domain-containing transglutaminase family protein [Chthoniobacterales bacterium]